MMGVNRLRSMSAGAALAGLMSGCQVSSATTQSDVSSLPFLGDFAVEPGEARSVVDFAHFQTDGAQPLRIVYRQEADGRATVEILYYARAPSDRPIPNGLEILVRVPYEEGMMEAAVGPSKPSHVEMGQDQKVWIAESGSIGVDMTTDRLTLSVEDVTFQLQQDQGVRQGPFSGTISGDLIRECYPARGGAVTEPVPSRSLADETWTSEFCRKFRP